MRYLLLSHFARARENVRSALVPEEHLLHTNHECRSSDGQTTRSSEEDGETEAKERARQTGEKEGRWLHDPPFISPG